MTIEATRDGGEGHEDDILERLNAEARAYAEEIGAGARGNLDLFFVGFLRSQARFGVFSFGPITLAVPAVESLVERRLAAGESTTRLRRFTELVRREQVRRGRRRAGELEVLLAFMQVEEGAPYLVFGELGISPRDVEAFADSGGRFAGPGGGLEPLYSPEEAAAYLGVHVETVRAWIRSGRLRAHRLAGRRALRIRASDLGSVLEPLETDDAGERSGR